MRKLLEILCPCGDFDYAGTPIFLFVFSKTGTRKEEKFTKEKKKKVANNRKKKEEKLKEVFF